MEISVTTAPVGNLSELMTYQDLLSLRMNEINTILVDGDQKNVWVVRLSCLLFGKNYSI